MKTKLLTAFLASSMVGFIYSSVGYAEDTSKSAESHEAHHPKANLKSTPESSQQMKMGSQGGMMGKMDMKHMMGMMHECMDKHKDGKMCEDKCMTKCQENMGKDECSKMMGQMKIQEHKSKK